MTDFPSRRSQPASPSEQGQLDLFGSLAPPDAPPAGSLDASSETLSRIGHDLRTALNAILGFSEIMTQRLHGPLGHPKYDEYAQHVRFSGEALLNVSIEVMELAGRNIRSGGGQLPRL